MHLISHHDPPLERIPTASCYLQKKKNSTCESRYGNCRQPFTPRRRYLLAFGAELPEEDQFGRIIYLQRCQELGISPVSQVGNCAVADTPHNNVSACSGCQRRGCVQCLFSTLFYACKPPEVDAHQCITHCFVCTWVACMHTC